MRRRKASVEFNFEPSREYFAFKQGRYRTNLVFRRCKRGFDAELGPETLALTTLGQLQAGDRVHLERPLRLGDELGGHLVSGHVDGMGRVAARKPQGDSLTLRIAAPAEVGRYLAKKGSVTVDGVSLTINEARRSTFSVTLIPHTLSVTCLGERRPGDRVNIEADLLAKQSNIDNVELKEEFVVVKINDPNVDYSFIPQILLQNGYRLRMFREEELSLEDAFMVLTKGITN